MKTSILLSVVTVFIWKTVISQVTYTACEDGWIPFEGSCYSFGLNRLTHPAAQTFCQKSSAHLIHVDNERENNFVKNWLHFYTAGGYWLGLTDTDEEGHFVWTDDSAPVSYTDWYPGQPNNYLNKEDCAQYHKSYKYQWSDTNCTYAYNAICEKTGQAYQVSN